MPIYAYLCKDCGFEKDALQKLSDPPLTVCPSCSKTNFVKKLTAPSFQLKGTGWYATDFRENGKKPDAKASEDGSVVEVKTEGAKSGDAQKADAKGKDSGSDSGSTGGAGSDASKGGAAGGKAGDGASGNTRSSGGDTAKGQSSSGASSGGAAASKKPKTPTPGPASGAGKGAS